MGFRCFKDTPKAAFTQALRQKSHDGIDRYSQRHDLPLESLGKVGNRPNNAQDFNQSVVRPGTKLPKRKFANLTVRVTAPNKGILGEKAVMPSGPASLRHWAGR
jgi:hypothetical protein